MKRIAIITFVCILCSCTERFFAAHGEAVDVAGTLNHDMIVLGDKLEDPYTVENMGRALSALFPTKGRVSLAPTDYYVRFLPFEHSEFERLLDLGLELLDHPMDYSILREGDYYHDPSLDDDAITWQYAVVPSNFVFPDDVKWEKLDECYIADHDPGTKADGIDWAAVEEEAYRLTGNAALISPAFKADAAVAPSGRIAVMDPEIDSEPIGVKGIRVMANSFVKISTAYTDDEGYYTLGKKFQTEVRYRLVFKNEKGFALGMNLLLLPASVSTLGKSGPEGVSIVVDNASERKLFSRCAVNNAAYDYWNSCSEPGGCMSTPPGNLRIWLFQKMTASSALMMQQGVMVDNTIVGDFLGEYSSLVKLFLPDITLGVSGADKYSQLYAITLHELAHASHFSRVGINWWDSLASYMMKSFITSGGVTYGLGTESDCGYCEVAETWAYYMQTRLMQMRYPDSQRIYGTSFWFYPQIFLYLDDRGIDRFRLFAALDEDVSNRSLLQQRLSSLYPEFKSMITQAFTRYH